MRRLLLVLVSLLSFQALAQPPSNKPPRDPIWEGAEQEVERTLESIQDQHKLEQQQGYFHHKLVRGDPDRKEVCLTFDDGPHPGWTMAILNVLREHHVKATFFVVGHQVVRYPHLLKAIISDGHQVANHTYHHRNLTRLSDQDVAAELQSCEDEVFRVGHIHMSAYRPPGGQYNLRVADVGEKMGYTLALWTDDPGDYASPGAGIIEKRLLDRLANGGVILLHDGIAQTLLILPTLLEHLRQKGFQLVTVEKMVADSPPVSPPPRKPSPTPSPARKTPTPWFSRRPAPGASP